MSKIKKRVSLAALVLVLLAIALNIMFAQTGWAQPFYDWGDAPDSYSTLSTSTGANHILDSTIYLGSCVDAESDGVDSAAATGDDTATGAPIYGSCAVSGDDEDGVEFLTPLVPGATASIRITASVACTLTGWIDFNADGDWDDSSENLFIGGFMLGPGSNPTSFSIPSGAVLGDTFARFRCTTGAGADTYTGLATDGEVEDYMVTIQQAIDWGDAPNTYGTTNLASGPNHIVTGPFMGACVDSETDGLPSVGADGDDSDVGTPTGTCVGNDDEDGVTFTSLLTPGSNAGVDVDLSNSPACTLNAWIDFNIDGDFWDAGEQIFTDESLTASTNNSLVFAIPAGATSGATYSRFRCSTDTGLISTGAATDGEVEDHPVTISSELVAIGNAVWIDDGAGGGTADNGALDGTEVGADGVTVELYNSGDIPGVDAPVATATTAGGGYYEFDNMTPGNYFVHISASNFAVGQPLEGYLSSTGAGADETTDHTGDENGIDNATPATNGISTMNYALQPDTEVTGEDQTNYTGTLDDDNVNFTADFGFVQSQQLASIGDTVWRDDDHDGTQNEVGTGIAGVTVNLYDGSGAFQDSTDTDGTGLYSFADLAPGDYYVEFILPSNYLFSPQDAGGNDTLDSDADPTTGRTINTTLDPGENDPTWDCGMFLLGPAPAIQIEKEVAANGWIAPNVPSVAYTLTVTNIGDVTLNPVAVIDDLDPGLTFVPGSAIPAETSVTGQQIYWADITAGAGLAPTASTVVAFQVYGPVTPGIYDNFALAEGFIATGGSVTDTARVSLLVDDPEISIDKTLNPPGVIGDLVTFTIYIENTGPSTIDVLPLYDSFSGPAVYYGGDPIPNTIDNITQQLMWDDLTIPFGMDLGLGQAFYVITVFQLTNPTTYTVINTAQIPPGGTDVYTNPINQPRSETAVEMIDFYASQWGQSVRMNWETAAEVDTYGFRILRDSGRRFVPAEEIAFIPSQAHGGAMGASYEFRDNDVAAGQTYTYWLMDVDMNGIETINGPAEVTILHGLVVYLPLVLR
ncbi:MAG: hypothetical protein GY832_29325 [Chloroflexi bacterium]|nr:hypothetical protein [Chloroflexota bacterium]